MRGFHVATIDEILRGEVTDVYFVRTVEVLRKAGLSDVVVRAEFHVSSLPSGYKWGVFTGLKEVVELLRGRPVTLYSLPEGTIFYPDEPLMVIEGRYVDFAVFETPILGILRHYTSISTKAARIKKLAGDKQCIFFGARVLHPAIQPMADRAAYIGGFDGVSNTKGAELIGVKPVGTMPHALMIIFKAVKGDHTQAWIWFDKALPDDVPRIALVDTFYDEREEAVEAAKVLGNRLWGVRLDTPSSRRGSMSKIVKEVRWTLDLLGYSNVKIFVSGGIDESSVVELRDLVDGFGVGTSIAFPPSIDIAMDIVEVLTEEGWKPITKRGKLPGFKQIYVCPSGERKVLPWGSEPPICSDGSRGRPLIRKYLERGELVEEIPSEAEIRRYVLEQIKEVQI